MFPRTQGRLKTDAQLGANAISNGPRSVTCEALGRGIFWGKLHHRRVLVRVVDPSHNSLAEVPSGGAIRVVLLGLLLDRQAMDVWARESFFGGHESSGVLCTLGRNLL